MASYHFRHQSAGSCYPPHDHCFLTGEQDHVFIEASPHCVCGEWWQSRWGTVVSQRTNSMTFANHTPPFDELERMPELANELVASPIVGVRAWGLDRYFNGQLTGIGHPVVWDAPIMHACCSVKRGCPFKNCTTCREHVAPVQFCACGVWALRLPGEAEIKHVFRQYSGSTCAWGTVELWGRVIEHKRGFRAEYARPREIYLLQYDNVLAATLEHRYQCEVKKSPLQWTSRVTSGAATTFTFTSGSTPVLPVAQQQSVQQTPYFYQPISTLSVATRPSRVPGMGWLFAVLLVLNLVTVASNTLMLVRGGFTWFRVGLLLLALAAAFSMLICIRKRRKEKQ